MSCITTNLKQLTAQIRQAEMAFHRTPGSVTLLAVSKRQAAEKIAMAFEAGQKAFGESYLQESLEKQQKLSHLPIEWHFIGNIQSNKTKLIAEHFDWVHSVNRASIAERLNKQRPDDLLPLNVCIEVNIDNDTSKSGTSTDQVFSLAQTIADCQRLKLRGLMVIPSPTSDADQQLAIFHQLADLQQKLIDQGFSLDTLSMGMSNDFEMAIKAGSTCVRIGTALFGSRD